jgi:peptidoglycan hydrolase-like protein with peptidoglycan-binding domain
LGGKNVPDVAAATTEVAQAVGAVQKVSVAFVRDLELGMEGEDVKALQQFLNDNDFTVATVGVGSPGNETDYFGSKTQAAVAKYQKAHDIAPTAGYFGPKTRAHVARLAAL